MPLDEQGQKWSCEPCLRGHRSSKCKHFDRLMARVAKSGRPSKACPHGRLYCDCRKSYAVMERLASGMLASFQGSKPLPSRAKACLIRLCSSTVPCWRKRAV
ncbi:hypothetical protein ASPVEDRAFT_42940 [Aspergillus versicolor CBS 583.65]|uniref:Copper-fist domain-containing protein n=1 Tax=Aspergillus versicolor CBS 583.65 TaxID=1036611 RepID=A0A1L9PPQ0_ASPVE|nr:uncharacterized protein ASPVEDRAFT_42940 [Aspergillus versicolor CBS 583.65]OJJ03481.1 hypothetical protein ASPVEDRAFT_42940 [Aspergillus versicolor CBS 583.65]